MSKMTDEQIKKGLECCRKYPLRECKKCPYLLEMCCDTTLKIDLIDLINRQQKTIKTLRNCVEQHHIIRKDGKSPLSLLTEEIKAETIKDFAEKVKMAFYYEFDELIPSIMADKIDNLVKEMVGEQNDTE